MMKKRLIWLLVALALIVFVFNVGVILYLNPQISGNVVEEANKTRTMPIKIVREDSANQVINRCIVSPPLYCNVWKVLPSEKRIILQIGNSVFGTYVVSEVQIKGCEIYSGAVSLSTGEARTVALSCDIKKGEVFNSEILISYRKARTVETQISNGIISQEI